jgi:hypothetical protein
MSGGAGESVRGPAQGGLQPLRIGTLVRAMAENEPRLPDYDEDHQPRWLLAQTLRARLAWLLEEVRHAIPWRPWRARRALAAAIRLLDEDGAHDRRHR